MTETETQQLQQLQQQLQVLDLKYQAVLQKLSTTVVNYEDQDANRRAEISLLIHERDNYKEQLDAFEPSQKAAGETIESAD